VAVVQYTFTHTILRTTRNKQYIEKYNNLEECGPCPIFAGFTLAFALQLRIKHGKTSVRVAEEYQCKLQFLISMVDLSHPPHPLPCY